MVDRGFDAASIGVWTGFYGMAFSIAGSVAGGGLNSRLPPMKSLLVASCLECIPQLGRWALSVYPHPPAASDVIGLICFEAFTGGLLTTVMFCFMMSQVGDKGIGASHYTMLASLEVAGKSVPALVSGVIAEKYGLPSLFLVGATLSALYTAAVLAAVLFTTSERDIIKQKRN